MRSSPSETSAISTVTVPDSTLARSRMLLSRLSSSLPDEWMTLAYSTWVSVMLWSGLSSSCWARISRLFSGVRSSWDMLAMNSDLYFDETASWPAFSSTSRFDSSTSRFFCSASMFCSASSRAWRPRSSFDSRSSSCCERSSSASDCDCSSRVSVSVSASIVLSTRPMLSVSWSRNAWCVTLNGENDASSTTARTDPSNRTGSTMMLSGVAAPSPELIRT